jgi:hypothetical protein
MHRLNEHLWVGIRVELPIRSDGTRLELPAFVTGLPFFSHAFHDLAAIALFHKLEIHSAAAPISVKVSNLTQYSWISC